MIEVPNSGETLYGVPPPLVPGTKCEHGIYIPPGDEFAQYCSLCQFYRGHIVPCVIPRNKALGDLDQIYADYAANPSDQNTEYLFKAILIYANRVAKRFNKNMPDMDYAAIDAASAVHMQLDKFSPEAKFSTWAFAVIYHSLVDHQRRAEAPFQTVPLEEAVNIPVTGQTPDMRLYFGELMSKLTEQEHLIFNMHAQGFTHEQVAEEFKVSLSTAKRYWRDIEDVLIGQV